MSDDSASYYSAAPTPPAPPAGLGYPPQPQYGQAPYQQAPYQQAPYPQAPYQQAPYQPWGGGYSYPPQAPRHRRTWIVLGVGAVVVVVALIAVAVGFFVHSTNAAKKVGVAYLSDLQTGQYAQAYDLLCNSDQVSVTEAQFAAAKAAVHPVTFSTGAVDLHTSAGTEYAVMHYQELRSDGSGGAFEIVLIKSGGTWQVCHS